jgi:energy-coupling factor transport system permease protein
MMAAGRYVATGSPLHRADPRAKVVAVLLVMVALFVGRDLAGTLPAVAATAAALALGRTGPRAALAALRPLSWLMLFVLVFDALLARDGTAVVVLGPCALDLSGALVGAVAVVRLALVLLVASCLTRTTTPTQLTDATRALLSPLVRRRSTLNDLSLAMGITLRYVPVLVREWGRVREAQSVRLARLDEGGLAVRLRALLPVIVPVFVRAYRSAEVLALAVENRGYDASARRSCFRTYRLRPSDGLLVLLGAAVLVAAIVA